MGGFWGGDEREEPAVLIAIEEHFFEPGWNEVYDPDWHAPRARKGLIARMEDLGADRIAEMDAAGIDMQVISHGPPGAQGVRPGAGADWTRRSNDVLAAAVAAHPDRLAGLASVPTDDPEAGADELARAVEVLGMKGAVLHTLSAGPTLDDPRFLPIFARAAELGVPIYLHPADPGPRMMQGHYAGYSATHPTFVRASWGFMVEAGTQAMRLVLSGLFDRCPNLQIILGHFGETIPFQLARIDESLSRDTPMKNFREVFSRHFHVTTSGFFSDPALACVMAEIGVERILFAVDWPFAGNAAGADWFRAAPLSDPDRELIAAGNARRLLRL